MPDDTSDFELSKGKIDGGFRKGSTMQDRDSNFDEDGVECFMAK